MIQLPELKPPERVAFAYVPAPFDKFNHKLCKQSRNLFLDAAKRDG
jgi:hypothetical protein